MEMMKRTAIRFIIVSDYSGISTLTPPELQGIW